MGNERTTGPGPATLEEELIRRGIDLDDVRVDESGSVVPPARSMPANIGELVAALPMVLGDDGDDPSTHQLEMGELLGEGGMGEVVLAEQIAMRRQVAVKVQHRHVDNPAATIQLLREARVTGYLEHPNIVPVHTLGRDAEGRPHIVMKRIEGVAWTRAIRDRPAATSDDNLAFHINTLIQAIRAVSFAHSRGVLHLDIKPDNVMIGAFDEIYLVDWGVAVRLDPRRGPSEVPSVDDIEHIVGTPQYMAPELVTADGICECTDVYLLGACLHQVLTGEPPHDGTTMHDVFSQAFLSTKKEYDDRWPRELVEIARKAMHPLPDERYLSAAELGTALTTFLAHRHARQVAAEARERLRQLEALLDDAAGADEMDAADRRPIYDTFSACRFGYELALSEWPEHGRARRGLQRCLERMIDFELRHGSPQAAAAYLADLPKKSEGLAERIARAERRAEAKGKAFERLRRDADVTVGDRLRGVVAAVTGLLWGLAHLAVGWLRRDGMEILHIHMVMLGGVFVLSAIVTTFVGRKVFFNTAANARLAISYVTVFVGYTAIWFVASRVGIAFAWTLTLFLVCSTMVWTVLALSSDRRILPLPAALLSTILAISVLPIYAFELFGVASMVGPLAVALMWLRKE